MRQIRHTNSEPKFTCLEENVYLKNINSFIRPLNVHLIKRLSDVSNGLEEKMFRLHGTT